jgi:phage-related protein
LTRIYPRGYVSSAFEVRFYASTAGRSQPTDFLWELPARDGAQIVADMAALRDHGLQAPISMKPIKGRPNRGMFEIRTGGFRSLFCQKGGVVWILHICKKQDQDAGIETARSRMKKL